MNDSKNYSAQLINAQIAKGNENGALDTNLISDCCHTFGELYIHRTILFATICNDHPELAWKSKQHDDPAKSPMYPGYFICGINTPQGPATYHTEMKYWNMFKVKELPNAPKWDGHTPNEAIARIASLNIVEKKEEG